MKLSIKSHTKPSIGLCTLGSMNWGKYRHPEEMRKPIRVLYRSLHNILQYQDFLTVQSKYHNEEFEPIGVGITDLAHWAAKRKLKYGEPDMLAEVKRWIEHQAFYLIEASMETAKEKGPCKEFKSSWYAKGVFPWERRAPGVNELTDFTPDPSLDWEGLRANILKYGMRNVVLMACPPVESSSVLINTTNGFELPKTLISGKESKAGIITQVVPEYKKLAKHYQLMFEQPDCLPYLKVVAVLQAYVDQGLSSNTFYSPKFFNDNEGKIPITMVIKNLMLAHHWGFMSHYYNLFDKNGAIQSIENESALQSIEGAPLEQGMPLSGLDDFDDGDCESCKL